MTLSVIYVAAHENALCHQGDADTRFLIQRQGMILGIGTDLVDIRRIERVVRKFPEAFWRRISSEQEVAQDTAHNTKQNAPHMHTPPPLLLAKRFASKEACSKSLGVGIGAFLSFHDMTLENGLKGPPNIHVREHVLTTLWPQHESKKIRLDLSLSDEYPYVQAFVVMSKL
ncbi:holo-ACP synthase [Candidatus Hepatobacter penaei]|uniref:holo-ACP synthase n=1 Tax=Candidatus Hepatobacter penaei TaxID=1274402 RepID=UPI000A66BD02|nr:holo-ACP synthase [Candidatus Hepatobacter penaei]